MKVLSFGLSVLSAFLFFLCETQAQRLWVVYHDNTFDDTRHINADGSLNWNANGFADQFGDTYLPIVYGASPIEYNGVLYVFRGIGGGISYTTFDGENYSADTHLNNVGAVYDPSPVVYNGQLYVFHQGSNDGTAWYSVYDSTTGTWQGDQRVPYVSLLLSPGAVVFNGLIYLFFRASSNQIQYLIFDGIDWSIIQTIPNVGTYDSPAPVVYGGSLYVFFRGEDNTGLYYTSINTNDVWSAGAHVPNMKLSSAPSPIVVNGILYVFHQGSDIGPLYCVSYDGSWSSDQLIDGISITDRPGVAWTDF